MTEPKLNEDSLEDKGQEATQDIHETIDQEQQTDSEKKDESNGSGSKWLLILLILAVVVIGGIYLYDRSQENAAAEEAEKTAIEETIAGIFDSINDVINVGQEKNSCVATTFDGNTYEHGQSYTTEDGCQTCECNDGSWNCQVDDECLNPPKADCTYNGETYNAGDTFPAGDDCNTCECSDGAVDCTSEICNEEPPEGTE